MPQPPEGHRLTLVPVWVCEVLSTSTESRDRGVKMPTYVQFGVADVWLLDPRARALEAHTLEGGGWREIGRFTDEDLVRVAPFDASPLRPQDLWIA